MKSVARGLDKIGMALPLPNVHPNVISGFSVLSSIGFLLFFAFSPLVSLLFLVMTLLFDWLDGVVARKFKRTSEEGYLADLMSDRLSEGLIFSVFFFPWFYFFVLNCVLSMIAVRKRRHIILPLRHVFFIFYAVLLMI